MRRLHVGRTLSMNTKWHIRSLRSTGFDPLDRCRSTRCIAIFQTAISGDVGHMLHRFLLLGEGGMARLVEWGNLELPRHRPTCHDSTLL
jgi:hypothetical protein